MSGGEGPAKARLFVALDLPEPAREALVAWQRREVAPLEGVTAIRPEALHVTLAFLGWRAVEDADRVGELVRGAAAPVGELALGDVVWLPPRRPRVLAVDLVDEGGGLRALQGAVSEALAAGAGYVPEKRPYRPHVTVGRMRGRPPSAAVRDALPGPPEMSFPPGPLTLYRSHLAREGARYEPLARVPVEA